MGDFAQELQGVPLFLERIALGVGGAVDFQGLCLHLHRLPLAHRFNQRSLDAEGRTGGYRLELVIGESRHIQNNLEVFNGGAVIEGHELNVFVAAAGTDPSLDADLFACKLGGFAENICNFCTFHLKRDLSVIQKNPS